MTAPRWITEAIEAAFSRPDASADPDGRLANALIGRLPLEAMVNAIRKRIAGVGGITGDWIGAIAGLAGAAVVQALTDGDPEVVQLTELYQRAVGALDSAGVPRAAANGPGAAVKPIDLADRIKWLARDHAHAVERFAASLAARDAESRAWLDKDSAMSAHIRGVEAERDDRHRLALRLREMLEKVCGQLFDVELYGLAMNVLKDTEHITKDLPNRHPLTREKAEELARRIALRTAYRSSDWRPERWVIDAIIEASR